MHAFVRDDIETLPVLAHSFHHTESSIHPLLVLVVLDEDDLSAHLQFKIQRGRHGIFRKIPLNGSFEREFLGIDGVEVSLVDAVHHITSRCQRDGEVLLRIVHPIVSFRRRLIHPHVEELEVGICNLVFADMVENPDECWVRLPVNLGKFHRHKLHLPEHMCRKEIRRLIKTVDDVAFVACDHRLQLKDIPHKQHLLTPKGDSHVSGINPQNTVDKIDDVGPDHGNLINDDQFKAFDEFHLFLVVFEECPELVGSGIVWIVGGERMERKFEKTVERLPSHIDGGNSRRCEHHGLFLYFIPDIFEESGFPSPRLSREEKGIIGELDNVQRVFKLGIFEVHEKG